MAHRVHRCVGGSAWFIDSLELLTVLLGLSFFFFAPFERALYSEEDIQDYGAGIYQQTRGAALTTSLCWGQQFEQGNSDVPLPGHLHQLLRGDTKMVTSQLRDPPWGLLPDGHAQNSSPGRRAGGIMTRCPNHFNWLLSKRRSSGSSLSLSQISRTPHPISKAEPSPPAKKVHFHRLFLQSHFFGHYPDQFHLIVKLQYTQHR